MPTASRRSVFRVRVRVALGKCLDVVLPEGAVWRLRARYAEATGHKRTALHFLVALARHRRLPAVENFALYDDPTVRLVVLDSQIVKRLFWYGRHGYEGQETDWWASCCREASVVLEVGANIGYYSIVGGAAVGSGRYIAVEAHPESVATTQRNVELNHLDHVEVVHAAVTGDDTAESVWLAIPTLEDYAAPTGAFITTGTESVGERRPAKGTIRVPALSMTKLMDDVDLLKLDVEGLEHRLLRPILDVVIERRVTLFVELLRGTPQLRGILADLVTAGYVLHVVTATGLVRLDAQRLPDVDLTREFASRDVIAHHVSKPLPEHSRVRRQRPG